MSQMPANIQHAMDEFIEHKKILDEKYGQYTETQAKYLSLREEIEPLIREYTEKYRKISAAMNRHMGIVEDNTWHSGYFL
jgi:hypothetical protein